MSSKDTKKQLSDLKAMLDSGKQLDTSDLIADNDLFNDRKNKDDNNDDQPVQKYIDYDSVKLELNSESTRIITNIIHNYIKNKKLLSSNRLKDLKMNDIKKLTRILLLIYISENNLIRLQEFIDMGDISKETFDSVNKVQNELRANMKMKDEHLKHCEEYWEYFADVYGLKSLEEEVMSSNEDKEESKTIIDISSLNKIIKDIEEE